MLPVHWKFTSSDIPLETHYSIFRDGLPVYQSAEASYSNIYGKNPAYDRYNMDIIWNVDGLNPGTYTYTLNLSFQGTTNHIVPVTVRVINIAPVAPLILTQSKKMEAGSVNISWQPVDNCSHYAIYINNTLNLTVSASFNTVMLDLTRPGIYQITITALNEICESQKSNICEITILEESEQTSDYFWITLLAGSVGIVIGIVAITLIVKRKKNRTA